MHANELTDLGEAIERRATRAIARLRADTWPIAADTLEDLCRKAIGDELTSEWLRMHQGRRLKRAETALLVRMYRQIDDAVQVAIAHVEPQHMPARARDAISVLAAPAQRRP